MTKILRQRAYPVIELSPAVRILHARWLEQEDLHRVYHPPSAIRDRDRSMLALRHSQQVFSRPPSDLALLAIVLGDVTALYDIHTLDYGGGRRCRAAQTLHGSADRPLAPDHHLHQRLECYLQVGHGTRRLQLEIAKPHAWSDQSEPTSVVQEDWNRGLVALRVTHRGTIVQRRILN